MFTKFSEPSYMEWPNVINSVVNCTPDGFAQFASRGDSACWSKVNCALNAADASQNAQYSSATTILGLLPTVLLMMATSSDDLLQLHHQYPIIAFLLSLCNPSTAATTLSTADPLTSAVKSNHALYNERSPGYLSTIRKGHWISKRKSILPISDLCHDLAAHVIAMGLAMLIVWESIILGARGVIVFACWTWHEPFTWVGVGGLIHLLNIFVWRLCLGRANPKPQTLISTPTGRWRWTLASSTPSRRLELKHPKIARFAALCFQVLGLMNYGYGTVMLSGTTLVSPINALKVFCRIGFSAVTSRLVVIWLLEVFPRNAKKVPTNLDEELLRLTKTPAISVTSEITEL